MPEALEVGTRDERQVRQRFLWRTAEKHLLTDRKLNLSQKIVAVSVELASRIEAVVEGGEALPRMRRRIGLILAARIPGIENLAGIARGATQGITNH